MRKLNDPLAPIGAQAALLWTGLSIGVAFIATPAKFLADSLSLPVALDVGRHTFMVANRVELALCCLLSGLAVAGAPRWRWALGAGRWALGAGRWPSRYRWSWWLCKRFGFYPLWTTA